MVKIDGSKTDCKLSADIIVRIVLSKRRKNLFEAVATFYSLLSYKTNLVTWLVH